MWTYASFVTIKQSVIKYWVDNTYDKDRQFDLDLWPEKYYGSSILWLGATLCQIQILNSKYETKWSLDIVWTTFEQRTERHDLWPWDPKINWEHLLSMGIQCQCFKSKKEITHPFAFLKCRHLSNSEYLWSHGQRSGSHWWSMHKWCPLNNFWQLCFEVAILGTVDAPRK